MVTRVSIFLGLLFVTLIKAKSNRIIGGDLATSCQFKYQVSVQVNHKHRCGGAIIADQYVLTAAHCVANLNEATFKQMNFQVSAGSINLYSHEGVRVDVEKIYVPMKFFLKDRSNDIAVLKLQRRLELSCNPKLQKVDLPSCTEPSHIGDTAVMTGYGVTHVEVRKNPTTGKLEQFNIQMDGLLKYAMVNIISNSECVKKSSMKSLDDSNQSCGQTVQRGGHPEGICKGDSGGPLVIGNTIIGVASQGSLSGDEQLYPAIYTRVSSFLGFITDAMKDAKSTLIAVREIHSGEGSSGSK